MKVLVTGGTGFLGRRLMKQLQHEYPVFNYDITSGYDILDINQLDDTFKEFNPNIVIHLAACADLNIFRDDPTASHKINVIGTQNILNMCQLYNARLLFASTCCCYGNNDTHPSDETSPTCPTEPYARSKLESEHDILKVGLPHCCMRLATFYGPEMRGALAPAIFIDKISRNEPIEIHGTGDQTRTLTYVDDIVSGIITIIKSPPTYTIINITAEETISVNDLISCAQQIVGNKVPHTHVIDRPGQIYKELIKSSRLQSLGWQPTVNLKEGLQRSFDYYKLNGNKWQ